LRQTYPPSKAATSSRRHATSCHLPWPLGCSSQRRNAVACLQPQQCAHAQRLSIHAAGGMLYSIVPVGAPRPPTRFGAVPPIWQRRVRNSLTCAEQPRIRPLSTAHGQAGEAGRRVLHSRVFIQQKSSRPPAHRRTSALVTSFAGGESLPCHEFRRHSLESRFWHDLPSAVQHTQGFKLASHSWTTMSPSLQAQKCSAAMGHL
jgi:hypothetical protein